MKDKIRELIKQKNGIILAHNYQPPEIQEIADLCGDSLELSIKASKTEAEIILCCGVKFMAETASILSPEKRVLLPVMDAGCPMADMVTPEALKKKKDQLGGIPVVTYVNSTAAVKALSDICCTSANVIDVINSIDSDEILMTPDKNLAQYAASKTNKKIHLWEGYCPYHDNLTKEDVLSAKAEHPNALFIAHPECSPEVLKLADSVQSTSGMIRFVKETDHDSFTIGTEIGHLYPLSKACPDKQFFAASDKMFCEDMKKITYENVINCLENPSFFEVKVPENIRKDAYTAVKRMIDLK
ncbi:MAG: quinolinate synthase NadA [Desulfobacterales bacterium]|nr:quinolinate synthase NadA [Desulfobacterales bacterium]